MTTPLLTTKLYIPPARPGWVPRPRLIERLNTGLRAACKLTLISAPAGFGKTTLIANWKLSLDNFRVAWLGVDEGDNDPARFLAYVIAALQRVAPDIGKDLSDVLASLQSFAWDQVITELINQINDVPDRLLLVLDDYHHITAQPVHDMVAFLLDHQPANLHLVIATRADPPLPIPRLRGRGQLNELRLNDLRFTLDEASAFLENITGSKLAEKDSAALNARTEGWAAGLQMAATSLQGQRDISGFIQAFAGSHHHILDYLLEEVLQRQPEHVQTFLLQTCILDRLCGSLCDAVRGVSASPGEAASQAILEALEHANLFIVPLDDRCEWYRYHHLFGDLLDLRLHQSQPELSPALHHRASVWYEQQGWMEDAIEHALSGGDAARAAELIERSAEATLMRSQVVTFLHWMERLPEESLRARPTLSVYYALALLWNGASLDVFEKRLAMTTEYAGFSGHAAALWAFVALYRGQSVRAAELARQALEQLPESKSLLRSMAAFMQAAAQLAEGDAAAGIQALEEFAQASQRKGNLLFAALVLCSLGDHRQKQGRLRQAHTLYQQALDLVTDAQGRRLPVASRALIGLGDVAMEWGDFDTAARQLAEAIALAERWSRLNAFNGYLTLAQLKQSQGDLAGAQAAIQMVQTLAHQFDVTDMDDLIADMAEARLKIAQGDLAAARRWAKQRELDRNDEIGQMSDFNTSRLRKYEYPVVARLWLAEGHPDDVLRLYERALPQIGSMDRASLVIEAEILRALALQAKGDMTQALSALEHALTLAEPGGYVRVFVDEGEPLRLLLESMKAEGGRIKPLTVNSPLATYVDKLLAVYPKDEIASFRSKDEQALHHSSLILHPLVEPLSERELEVLRLLPSELSTTEMADRLTVSVNTVRTHLKNLYGKLGAHSRYEAIARAKEMELL